MKFVIFTGSIFVHAADEALTPLCGQTDGHRGRKLQQVIAYEPTCGRCLLCLQRQDKNSPHNRTRRRYLATRQALRDALTGLKHFERRTKDLVWRQRAAAQFKKLLVKMDKVAVAIQLPLPPRAKGEVT